MTKPEPLLMVAETIMSPDVLTVYEGWTIHRLAEFFIKHRISAAPVIASDHELVGVVSVGDIFRFQAMDEPEKASVLRRYYQDAAGVEINDADLRSWVKDADKNCTVHEIMNTEVISVDASDSIDLVIQNLVEHHVHRVFVTKNKIIVGVITTLDTLKYVKAA